MTPSSTTSPRAAAGGTGGDNNSGTAGSGFGGAVFALNTILTAVFDTFSGNIAEDGTGSALDSTDVYVVDSSGTGIQGAASSVTLTDDILGQTSNSTSDFAASTTTFSMPTMGGGRRPDPQQLPHRHGRRRLQRHRGLERRSDAARPRQ